MAITKAYKIEIDGQQANATVGQIKQEVERLEAELDGLQLGSLEADRVLQELGRAKSAINDLEEATDAAFDKNKAGAFVDAAAGIAGAFEIGTVAATNFGLLSTESAEKYQQKLTEMIAVVQGLESVHKLTTSEVRSALSGVFGSAKQVISGYLGIGQAATASGTAAAGASRVTRAAIAATGIGILLVLLGLVVVNWDRITGAVEKNRQSIINSLKVISPPLYFLITQLQALEKQFGSLTALVSGFGAAFTEGFRTVGAELEALLNGDVAGAEQLYAERGKRVAAAFTRGVKEKNAELAAERSREAAQGEAEELARQLAVAEAAGKDTYALRLKLLLTELSALKSGTQEELKIYKDKYNEIVTLQAGHNKKLAEDNDKATKEEIEKRKREAEKAKKDLEERLRKERESRAKARALLETDQQFEVDLLSAQGKDTLQLQIDQLQLRLKNNKKASEEERILFAKDEHDLAILKAQFKKREDDLDAEAITDRREARGQELTEQQEFVKQMTTAVGEGAKTGKELAKKSGNLTLGDTILTRVLGVAPEQLEATKALLNAAFQSASEAAAIFQELYFFAQQEKIEQQIAQYDERIAAIQERGQQIDQDLQAAQSSREALEKQVDGQKGARREATIARIAKERAAEMALAREKAKNDAAELKNIKLKEEAEKKKQELDRKGQIITAAGTALTNVATAADAVGAAVRAIKEGAKSPWPTTPLAILAALAAVGAAVGSAKKLSAAVKGEQGGVLVGNSHALGGIRSNSTARFSNIELEGGEQVVNRRATSNNLSPLATINKYGGRIQFAAVPKSMVRGADGGRITESGGLEQAAAGGGMVTVPVAQFDQMLSLLTQIAGNTQASAAKEPFVFDGPTSRRITDNADREKSDAGGGKLF